MQALLDFLFPKTPAKKQEERFYYFVPATPFLLYPPRERDTLLSTFKGFLSGLQKPVEIIVLPEWQRVSIDNEAFEVLTTNYFVILREDSGRALPGAKKIPATKFAEIYSKYHPDVVEVKTSHVKLANGKLARTLVAYSYGRTLPEGFLLEYYGEASEVYLYIEPINPYKVMSSLTQAIKRLDQQSEDEQLLLEEMLDRLELLAYRIKRMRENLYKTVLMVTITADTEEELKEKETTLREIGYMRDVLFDAPPFIQDELYYKRITPVKKLIFDGHSLRLFYPFVSDELRDPNGILLGFNPATRQPVIYNPFMRANYNIPIIGESGSGKSVTTKTIIKRLLAQPQWQNAYVYLLDPEGEYAPIAPRIIPGVSVVRFRLNRNIGLDPVKMATEGLINPTTVANFLMEVYEIPTNTYHLLKRDVLRSKDIFELADTANEAYRDYIQAVHDEPDVNIYSGELPPLSTRMVFDVSKIEDQRVQMMILSILAPYIGKKILIDAERDVPKLFGVDEAWRFVNFRSTMTLFNDIARTGRKRGIVFLFVTQRPADVIENDIGRTILEQSSTTLLLKQDEASIAALKRVYPLTEQEEDFLASAGKGEGLLKIGDIKIPIKVRVSQRELELFDTSPQSKVKLGKWRKIA